MPSTLDITGFRGVTNFVTKCNKVIVCYRKESKIMEESKIEKYLKTKVEKLGGECLKFNSGVVGVPDRLVIMPGGRITFIELKAPGKPLRRLQRHWSDRLNNLGVECIKIDSKEGVNKFIQSLL